LKGKVVSV